MYTILIVNERMRVHVFLLGNVFYSVLSLREMLARIYLPTDCEARSKANGCWKARKTFNNIKK